MSTEDVRRNLRHWEWHSADYQETHRSQLNRWDRLAWGTWDIPEEEVNALGSVEALDVLELGCGAAQMGIKVAMLGARVIGLDFSENQLGAALGNINETGVALPLVRGSAEELPFADASFDMVFCDHGATSFTDPHRTIPEAARVLRRGGSLVFNMATPLVWLAWGTDNRPPDRQLRMAYFELGRLPSDDPDWATVEWQLTYGDWMRLFRSCGLAVEDLIELRPPPDATTTYDFVPLEWARDFPAEHIWKVRKG